MDHGGAPQDPLTTRTLEVSAETQVRRVVRTKKLQC
jgi:hypothetical protein